MVVVASAASVVRFGVFDFDPKAGQLHRNGVRIRLSQKPRQVLCVLLDRPGEIVTREELQRLLWSEDVFVDFDHGLNKSVQRLREALGDSPESSRYIETIPRIGYRFIAPVVGETAPLNPAPPEEVFSPTAVQVPSDLRSASQIKSRGKWYAIGVCAAMVLVAAVWMIIEHQRQMIDPIRSIAVLPLENLSGDPGQEYFADGMTDELITMLAKNSTIRIVSRTSVMQYKSAHRPLREIANALGVDGVLEGSVSRSGDRVHMTIQLIRAATDAHIWAESYDRDADAVVSLPREAALTIAKRLNSSAVQPTPHYVNPDAHDAYIHGRYLWNAGQNDKAGEYFRRATELQPDYAPGWSGMSMYYGRGAAHGDLNPLESLPLAETAAIKAVQLDDSSAEAHMLVGGSVLMNRWDWTRAERESVRAIELDPNYSGVYLLRARIFAALNRYQEAIEAEKKATELDPFADTWALPLYYMRARQYDAALREAMQRLEATPDDPWLNLTLFDIYRCKGMGEQAAQFFEKALSLMGQKDSAESVRHAFQRGGYKAIVAWQIINLKKKSATQYISPVDLALCYAQLGRREETLSLLEEGYTSVPRNYFTSRVIPHTTSFTPTHDTALSSSASASPQRIEEPITFIAKGRIGQDSPIHLDGKSAMVPGPESPVELQSSGFAVLRQVAGRAVFERCRTLGWCSSSIEGTHHPVPALSGKRLHRMFLLHGIGTPTADELARVNNHRPSIFLASPLRDTWLLAVQDGRPVAGFNDTSK